MARSASAIEMSIRNVLRDIVKNASPDQRQKLQGLIREYDDANLRRDLLQLTDTLDAASK